MAGTKEGFRKRRETMIRKHGSEEAYLAHMREIAGFGGSQGHTGGFAANRELAREAGAKGGRISRRAKAKTNA